MGIQSASLLPHLSGVEVERIERAGNHIVVRARVAPELCTSPARATPLQ
jgi:hypothetical protein